MQETQVGSLGQEDALEKGMAIYSSVLAWRIPRTMEPGGLQSMGLQRVSYDWSDLACMQYNHVEVVGRVRQSDAIEKDSTR